MVVSSRHGPDGRESWKGKPLLFAVASSSLLPPLLLLLFLLLLLLHGPDRKGSWIEKPLLFVLPLLPGPLPTMIMMLLLIMTVMIMMTSPAFYTDIRTSFFNLPILPEEHQEYCRSSSPGQNC